MVVMNVSKIDDDYDYDDDRVENDGRQNWLVQKKEKKKFRSKSLPMKDKKKTEEEEGEGPRKIHRTWMRILLILFLANFSCFLIEFSAQIIFD